MTQVTSTRLAWTTYDPGHPLLIRSMLRLLGDGPGNTEAYRLSLLVAWEGAYLEKVRIASVVHADLASLPEKIARTGPTGLQWVLII